MTKFSDYGVILLTHMARQPDDETHSVTTLAGEAGLPLPMAQKILKQLAREGLVESQRGVNGGYRLSRSPESITALDMIHALEGPVSLTQCTVHETHEDGDDGEECCQRQSTCVTCHAWFKINEVLHQALRSVSLSDMATNV
jgi:FeS assembly SUF system regulator